MARNYKMTKRSEMASQTTANIIAAAEKLLTYKTLEEINLKAIAKEAGTTVQTVLRHMESREGCLRAVASTVAERVEKQRGNSEHSDIDAAISDLTDHYESEGKLVLNILAQEHRGNSYISELTHEGRAYHRKWVERCFDNFLPNHKKETIDALVVATDIYTWKLLRLDLGRSRGVVKNIITNMIKKLLEVS